MTRLILKCPYLPPNSSADRGGLASYIATRDGVEVIPNEKRSLRSSYKQRELIGKILRDFPDSENSFEYEDYITNPTIKNASEFITRALEDNYTKAHGRERYAQYISERPRVARVGEHGLFGSEDGPVSLSQVANEIRNHPGNVWTPILSLRREDAARLGYDRAENWQALLRSHAETFAQNLKIPISDLVWYAAYHDEGHHPHVHMLCYSRVPSKGFLTVDGIRGIKSKIVQDIFRHDLQEVYRQQTMHRTEVGVAAQDTLRELTTGMANAVLDSPVLMQLMTTLASRLRFHSGKFVYGYLRPPVKALVDSIVDELEKDPRVAAAYGKWCEARQEIIASYKDTPEPIKPLSQNKEFKSVRNMVVKEAAQIMRGDFTIEQPAMTGQPISEEQDSAYSDLPSTPASTGRKSGREKNAYEQYQLAKLLLEQSDLDTPRFEEAVSLMRKAADAGLNNAQYALGKLYADDERVKDIDMALHWLSVAATPTGSDTKGNPYAQYRLGELLLVGNEIKRDVPTALGWLELSANQDNPNAQYALGMAWLRAEQAGVDAEKAVTWLKKAAEHGNEHAAYELGKLFLTGELISKDTAEGLRWMTDSAKAENQYAQYLLGKFYLFGDEDLRDEKAAVTWLELSAAQGNVYAAFLLQQHEQWAHGSVLMSGSRILGGLAQILSSAPPHPPLGVINPHLDRKRRKELQQKKGGKGIQQAEPVPEQNMLSHS